MNSPSPNPANFHRNLERGNIKIRNMLATMERTFLPVGSTIGKYRIVEEIDRGGMAVVYKAIQLDLDREVALKVMPGNITINRSFVERFLTEAHAVAKLSHANIVKIYDIAMENSIYYLAMEYIPGENLYYYLNFRKPKLVEVLEIVSRLCDALGYAHRRKIIHRDLKLNNVIMKDQLTPVLIDFGLAKAMEDDDGGGITRTGEILGSPSYMAPERLLGGAVDHRSDVCSMGIMLYEMLTFKNPYLDQRNLHQTTLNVMEATPIPPRKLVPWLPVEIEAITLKAMNKDPSHRYQTMEEFKADINRYQRGEPVLAQPPSLFWRLRRFARRQWAPLVISGLVIFFVTLGGISWYVENRKGQSHWELVYGEHFGSKPLSHEWFPPIDSARADSTGWILKNGTLFSPGHGNSFVRLERRFNRDILIEFDIKGSHADLYNAGFFLFGDTPDSAYCIHVNRSGEAQCGITFPGSDFLLRDVNSTPIPLYSTNHVKVERIENTISFFVNGVAVAKVWDCLPPLGRQHEKIGFFVKGCPVVVDNLKVYRRAIPLMPGPTAIGDRFRERGDLDAALDEYKGLELDLSGSDIHKELAVKIADCLVRLNRNDEAMGILSEAAALKGRDETLQPSICLLTGAIYHRRGDEHAADSIYDRLAELYPESPSNLSAMFSSVLRVAGTIEAGKTDAVEREIGFLTRQYPRYSRIWGTVHLKLLDKYIESGADDRVEETARTIVSLHPHDNEVLARVKNSLGRLYLNKCDTEKAKDLFNQCVSANGSSDAVWDSWLRLAEICEYDFLYHDALVILGKAYRECPRSSLPAWMARVRMGELAHRDSSLGTATAIFNEVAGNPTVFPLPRLIARYYLNQINDSRFKECWSALYPGNRSYLYYFARKASFSNEEALERTYLHELTANIMPRTWQHYRLMKISDNLEHW